jgi:hypothetical protein
MISGHILRGLAKDLFEQACLCPTCLETVARLTQEYADPDRVVAEIRKMIKRTALAQEDYYFEDGNVVFTAAYHLKRGACCGSGCRHCPFHEEAHSKTHQRLQERL